MSRPRELFKLGDSPQDAMSRMTFNGDDHIPDHCDSNRHGRASIAGRHASRSGGIRLVRNRPQRAARKRAERHKRAAGRPAPVGKRPPLDEAVGAAAVRCRY